jgi:hypothetical protein
MGWRRTDQFSPTRPKKPKRLERNPSPSRFLSVFLFGDAEFFGDFAFELVEFA